MAGKPVVTLTHGGAVQGRRSAGVSRFLGIPYAAPPFGSARLRAPQPVVPWSGVRDAGQYGPTAPKGEYPAFVRHLLPAVVITGEECLNLNVWTPAGPGEPGEPRPVLVWIHGGSFLNGSNSLPEYDGTAFAQDGVVCVTINYRLGAEGFLQLPDAEPNRGLLDMVAALRWVREEIAAFGGDPGQVTVAGESAGAMAIGALLAMPSARGLFSRAILHSGAASNAQTAGQATRVTGQLAAVAGLPATRAALNQLTPAELTEVTGRTIAQAVNAASRPADSRLAAVALRQQPFGPVVDGEILPRDPLAAAADGATADVPVLLATTRDEARLFLVPPGALEQVDDGVLEAAATRLYGLTPAGLARYRASLPGESPADVLAAIWGDRRFLVPALQLAEAQIANGGPAWLARFDAVGLRDNAGLGSCHATDVPFAFATTGEPSLRGRLGPAPSHAAAGVLHGARVAFARSGDPGWPATT